jgi:cytochrome c556
MRICLILSSIFAGILVSSCASPYYKARDVKARTQIIARDASVGIGLVQHGPEGAMSTNASPDVWRAMFKSTLEVAADVMKTETQNTSVKISEEVNDDNSSSNSLKEASGDNQSQDGESSDNSDDDDKSSDDD